MFTPSITRLNTLGLPDLSETWKSTAKGDCPFRLATDCTTMIPFLSGTAPFTVTLPPMNSWKRWPYFFAM